MSRYDSDVNPSLQSTLAVGLARSSSDLMQAQQLRYTVFAEEMRARVNSTVEALDRDFYDQFCDHLIVRDTRNNIAVGTYRILSAEQAHQIGGFYSDQLFDLVRLNHLRGEIVEIARACVHPVYRSTAAIAMLWRGMTNYLQARKYNYLIVCVSLSMSDGGHSAASIFCQLKDDYLASVEYQAFPRYPLPLDELKCDLEIALPPVLAAYLNLGAVICGAPAWDQDFNTADILLLLPIEKLTEQFAKHFRNRPSAGVLRRNTEAHSLWKGNEAI